MRPRRVLSIDPVHRGCAFVLWDREIGLVDFGTRKTRRRSPHRVILRALREECEPELLVLEEPSSSTRRRPFSRVVTSLLAEAELLGVETVLVPRTRCRRDGTRLTKRKSALELAALYPSLGRYLPPVRRLWMSEHARTNIFDALALLQNYLDELPAGLRHGRARESMP